MILTSGFISFCTLFVGMCLFSMSSAHFYWYGGASVFVLVYMMCHCESTGREGFRLKVLRTARRKYPALCLPDLLV